MPETTTRKSVSFAPAGRELFGMLHAPKQLGDAKPPVLMLHGLTGSKEGPNRLFVNLAEQLAQRGYLALRVDLSGRGDSEGELIDATPQSDLEDAKAAYAFLRDQPGINKNRIGVVGFSYGGLLAASLGGIYPNVWKVGMWSCALSDDAWLAPNMNSYDGRDAAQVDGRLVSSQFYDGMKTLKPLTTLLMTEAPILMVHGTADKIATPTAVTKAKRDLELGAGLNVYQVTIDGADHAFTSHDAQENVIAETVRWII